MRWLVLTRPRPNFATLLGYLDHGASLVKTAASLHVHRNTVVYRLRRIEDLLVRPVTDHTLQIHAALLLAALLPVATWAISD